MVRNSARKVDLDRRRSPRYPVTDSSISIAIDGQKYACLNWSSGGFLIGGFTGSLRAGDEFTGTFHCIAVPPLPFRARVAHRNAERAELGAAVLGQELDRRG